MEEYMSLEKVREVDSDVAKYIDEELNRQQTTIELIATNKDIDKYIHI